MSNKSTAGNQSIHLSRAIHEFYGADLGLKNQFSDEAMKKHMSSNFLISQLPHFFNPTLHNENF